MVSLSFLKNCGHDTRAAQPCSHKLGIDEADTRRLERPHQEQYFSSILCLTSVQISNCDRCAISPRSLSNRIREPLPSLCAFSNLEVLDFVVHSFHTRRIHYVADITKVSAAY